MKKSEKLKNVVDKKVTEVKDTDIRFDKTKDYIYYSDVNVVEGELDIEYKNININFEDKDGVAAIVNKENEEMSKSPVYDETNEEANYNHSDFSGAVRCDSGFPPDDDQRQRIWRCRWRGGRSHCRGGSRL